MATVYEVMAKLTGDASGMVTAFRKANDAADKMHKGIKDRSAKIKSEMETLAVPAAVVTGGLLIAGKKIGTWAADAEQNVGAVETVFKKYADTVKNRSKDANKNVGLSASEYQSFSTLVGSQLKNLGTPFEQVADKSDKLIAKGADLASMFGGTTTNAIEAISSALKGEMDPIEKYGITLNQATLEATALKHGLVESVVDAGKVSEASLKMEAAQQKYNDAVKKYGEDSAQAKNAQAGLLSAERKLDTAKAGKIPKLDAETKAMAVQVAITEQSKDATGNFAREVDTVAHKQQVATATFRDAATKLGTSLLPAFAFLADMLAKVSEFVSNNTTLVMVFGAAALALAGGITAIVGVMKLWSYWTAAVNVINLVLNKTLKANVILLIVGLLIALVAGLITAYQKIGWFRDMVDGAWKLIKLAIKTVADWLVNTAWPMIKSAVEFMGGVFKWLYDVIIKPTWDNIRGAIDVAWQFIKLTFDAIVFVIKNVLGPVFSFLYKTFIKPNVDKAVFIIKNVLGPVFKFLYNTFIKPAWDKIKIVFKALAGYIGEKVAPKVSSGITAIGQAWGRLKKLALAPINFVIDTVINKGIVGTFNKIAKAVGSDAKLTPLKMLGMGGGGGNAKNGSTGGRTVMQARAKGGWTPAGMTLVGEEGPELVDFKQPSRVYKASDTNAMMGAANEIPAGQMGNALAKNPANNILPTGGATQWIGKAWDWGKTSFKKVATVTGDAMRSVGKWVKKGFAASLKHVVLPLYDKLLGNVGNNGGLPQLMKDGGRNALTKAMEMAAGFDKKKAAEGGGSDVGAQFVDGKLGRLFKPAAGGITSGFGTSRGKYPHAGIDFAVPIGSAVRSFFDGVVRKTGWNAVTGRTGKGMVVDHAEGITSYYGHLSAWLKKAGDKVKGGQTIARSGNTGRSTGPHLHAELWRKGSPFNYRSLLRDSGGVLPTGTSMVHNNTGENEMVLTGPQWDTAKKALTVGMNGQTGMIYVQVNLNGVDVNDKKTLERTGSEVGKQVWEAIVRAQRGGVYN